MAYMSYTIQGTVKTNLKAKFYLKLNREFYRSNDSHTGCKALLLTSVLVKLLHRQALSFLTGCIQQKN